MFLTTRNTNLIDELFDDIFYSKPLTQSISAPVDLIEDEKEVRVSVEIPGMNKDEINIEYKDGILKVSGEKKIEKSEKGHREIRSGKFSRSVSVKDIDFENGSAEYRDGVLSVILPKAEKLSIGKLKIK
jgi:HSP20 family protein